jgi:hypothetical protein
MMTLATGILVGIGVALAVGVGGVWACAQNLGALVMELQHMQAERRGGR